MNIRYRVELSQTERDELKGLLSGGRHAARKLKRAQILLAADAGASDDEIARNVGVGGSTVYRTKRRFVLGNLEAALSEEPRPGADRKLSGKEEALLVAKACSSPPEGRARWTLELLADEMVRLTEHDNISRETVRRRLAENELKPWRKDMWCIPQVDGEFVARMEDVLDLYAEEPDRKRPVVCFDESPTQLIGEVRQPIKAEPGQLERYDCEYKRNGAANLFIFLDVHRPWRRVKVTDSRTAIDFAACMQELVDVHFPKAQCIRVVLDNLSTHTAGALYQAFPPAEARRLLNRLEFHYVPKHASWLNMVEIEIGVLRSQCLDRRIDSKERLVSEIAAWERQRNASRARILGLFGNDDENPDADQVNRTEARSSILARSLSFIGTTALATPFSTRHATPLAPNRLPTAGPRCLRACALGALKLGRTRWHPGPCGQRQPRTAPVWEWTTPSQQFGSFRPTCR
jgi:transposase